MDFTTHNTPIASGTGRIDSSDSSLSPPLNTDQLEPPSESSPSINGLTDSSEDSEEDDGISEDDSDNEPIGASPVVDSRVERALKEMREPV